MELKYPTQPLEYSGMNPLDPPAKVTIIIVNYNSGRLLAKAIGCLAEQTSGDFQVLVMDNGSADGSDDVSAQYLRNRLALVRLGENLGFAKANNLAVARCDSEFVFLLNPDAFPAPDMLEKLLHAALTYTEYDLYAPALLMAHDPDYIDGLGDEYHITGLVWRNQHGARRGESLSANREIFSPCAAAVLMRRSLFLDLGGFDEDFFCYVEDVDLGFRAKLAGHKSLLVADALVYHMGSAISGKSSDFSVYHGHRNLVWAFVKNMPGALFWCLLPLHLAINLLSFLWFTARGRGSLILRAKLDALRGIPAMWRKRGRIQQHRRITLTDLWRAMNTGFPHSVRRAWSSRLR